MEGEPSEGVGGPFGGLPLFNTATCQERLDCTHFQGRGGGGALAKAKAKASTNKCIGHKVP